jgi:hypothetical protein
MMYGGLQTKVLGREHGWLYATPVQASNSANDPTKVQVVKTADLRQTLEVNTCTSMFIAALFTIAKLWKQSRCPTTNEWIKKMCLYTMEFYAAMKKNEMLSSQVNG